MFFIFLHLRWRDQNLKYRIMNLIIDYGNSSAKVGIFQHQALVSRMVFSAHEELRHFVQNFSGQGIIISSVSRDAAEIAGWATHFKSVVILDQHLPLPIRNNYSTPHTLGVDRIAAVCGAKALFPDQNCLVIDSGTCVTYEFVDASGVYHGGAISPGLKMRFSALNQLTARLPLVEPVESPELIGVSTTGCIQSGVVIGLIEEMNGVIRRYEEKFEKLQVILCGGDTPFFENQLKASIFASPELVLSGLNSILIYNVNR
jgi:type III pantothenate kinase